MEFFLGKLHRFSPDKIAPSAVPLGGDSVRTPVLWSILLPKRVVSYDLENISMIARLLNGRLDPQAGIGQGPLQLLLDSQHADRADFSRIHALQIFHQN